MDGKPQQENITENQISEAPLSPRCGSQTWKKHKEIKFVCACVRTYVRVCVKQISVWH